MRGSALWFTQEDRSWMNEFDRGGIDLFFCSDMLNVAEFRALLPTSLRNIPIVCYFHENQLTYPLSADDLKDYQFGITNITSCLASEAVWFNSLFHKESFLEAADILLRQMPDFVPKGTIQTIRKKSSIHYPPVDISPENSLKVYKDPNQPLTILWSHRWEYDKNPESFFDALLKLENDGLSFQLICLGEQFRTTPAVFEKVWDKLQKHIIHSGFVHEREDYLSMLNQCDVVVSTAIQENFGIAIVEAILAGCQPLLPNRLSYTEMIPDEFHATCLFASDQDLYQKLKEMIVGAGLMNKVDLKRLRDNANSRFSVETTIQTMDDALDTIVDH